MLFYIHLWYPSRFLFSWFFLSVKLHTFSHICNFLHMLVNEWRIHVCSWKDYLGHRFNVFMETAIPKCNQTYCMHVHRTKYTTWHEKNIKSSICIDVRECLFHHLIKKKWASLALFYFFSSISLGVLVKYLISGHSWKITIICNGFFFCIYL